MKKPLFIALLLSPLAHADQPLPTFQDFLNEAVPTSPLGSPNVTILSTVLELGAFENYRLPSRLLVPVKMGIWEESNQTKLVFAISSANSAWNDTYYFTCDTPAEQAIQTEKTATGYDHVMINCDSLKHTDFVNQVSLFDFKTINVFGSPSPEYKSLKLSFYSSLGKMLSSTQGPISERFKVVERSTRAGDYAFLSFGGDDAYAGETGNLTQEYAATDFVTYPPVETLQPLAPLPAKSTFTFYTSIHLPDGDEQAYDIATLKKKYEITATATNVNGYVMPLFNFYSASTSTNLNSVKMVMPYSFPSGDFVVNVTIKDKATGKQFESTIPGYKDIY